MFNRGDKVRFRNGGMWTFIVTDICNDACQLKYSDSERVTDWFPMIELEACE